jgi:L-threonylcarbamoyladenylate synthase
MSPIFPAEIKAAAARLRAGGIVAFPTETVYGLGADATDPKAVARIYAVKGRPIFNPLIAHLATLDQARAEATFSPSADLLAARFWPGPLTLVLPRAPGGSVCDLACAGLATIGLRIPDHAVAHDLLRNVGRPVAAPSANRSGRLSPTTAQDVTTEFVDTIDMTLDGGPCRVGVESTIVACVEDAVILLRPGGIALEAIEDVLGHPLAEPGATITAPGMMASHYAPRSGLRLNAREVRTGEVGLDFAATLGGGALDLSPTGDMREAAAALYGHLRLLDAQDMTTIAVAPIPAHGLGLAINDRLRRAAAPRPSGSQG